MGFGGGGVSHVEFKKWPFTHVTKVPVAPFKYGKVGNL